MPMTSDRGLFVWHELNTTDIEGAERFYTKLVGWKTTAWDPNPAYKIWTMGREGRAGLWPIHTELNTVAPPPHWLTYIGTPDVDATVRQAVELGGKVVTPAYDVAGVGRMAVLADPQGAMFAVSAQVERTLYKNPQLGEFSWHELLTTNANTAWDFYHKLFGWMKTGAIDMGGGQMYQMFGHGGIPVGGMCTPPSGVPGRALWLPYIMVRDAKRTLEAAKELGAQISTGPSEVSGGDWVFTAIDRQGAFFAAHSKKKETVTVAPTKATTKGTKKTKGKNTRKAKTAKRTAKKTAKKATSAKNATKIKSAKKKTARKPKRRR